MVLPIIFVRYLYYLTRFNQVVQDFSLPPFSRSYFKRLVQVRNTAPESALTAGRYSSMPPDLHENWSGWFKLDVKSKFYTLPQENPVIYPAMAWA